MSFLICAALVRQVSFKTKLSKIFAKIVLKVFGRILKEQTNVVLVQTANTTARSEVKPTSA